MKFGVIVFPGSNCDEDIIHVLGNVLEQPVIKLWHKDTDLQGCDCMVLPGGFSYGDVLGAGEGWAKSILFNAALRAQFEEFFARPDSFSLGVCNGCQMLAALKSLIPGTEAWPRFLRNRSDQFEARLVLVEIIESPSVLLRGMAGSRIPIVTAHGEGRAAFASAEDLARCDAKLTAARFIDNRGAPTEMYPANPNGSPRGIAGLSNADGRVTIMMPHPERASHGLLGSTDGLPLLRSLLVTAGALTG